jgi:hypothetical protein
VSYVLTRPSQASLIIFSSNCLLNMLPPSFKGPTISV